jgi:predicted TIM-barrel fold metal-dependent hydrolase
MSEHKTGEQIRRQLSHPVIDADGHSLEFLPAVREHLREIAGPEVAARLDTAFSAWRTALSLPVAERRALGLFRMTWWGFPTRNTDDRAMAMLPRLLYERLDEIGIDYAVLYPTFGLVSLSLDEPELRAAFARAFNRYYAEAYGELSDRLTHVALIPMHTPAEALAELDHAVGVLGFKAVVLAGNVQRPLAGRNEARAARWVDSLGFESEHDYDPVWRRCVELGVAPSFHSAAMGWGSRTSPLNYAYNHVGMFAAAGEATCRALFFGGAPMRFPELRFAFLEGGVAWACQLYADLVGHFEKRGREGLAAIDPAALDRPRMRALFARYAPPRFRALERELDAALAVLSDPEEDRSGIDEFGASGVERAEQIREVFDRFYFGCEADDPLCGLAFDARRNPFGARLHPLLGSDIGHWDVPDVAAVLGEAFEQVERGFLGDREFRDLVFANPVAFFASGNPCFFEGTRVAEPAAKALAAG